MGQTESSKDKNHAGSKYRRDIYPLEQSLVQRPILVDVYSVLVAFEVTNPGLQHAVKKLLCAGLRGKGSVLQDLREALDAVSRAIEIETQKERIG